MNWSIFDTLLDPVFVIDELKNLLYRNESFVSLCGLPIRKLPLQVPIYQTLQFSDETLFCMREGDWGRASATGYREVQFTAGSGNQGTVQIAIQPVDTEAGKNWVVFLHDVTLEASLHRKYRSELHQKELALKEVQLANESLEVKVQLRTEELSSINLLLSAILNSLGQGFLIFNSEGRCLPVYSRACQDLLERVPEGELIENVLQIPLSEKEEFRRWRELVFEEPIPFPDLADLGPKNYFHSQGRSISLQYFPFRGEDQKLKGVVLVATDRTREVAALASAERERTYVRSVIQLVQNRKQFISFVEEALDLLKERKSENLPTTLHTIKGAAASFGMTEARDLAHALEEKLKQGLPLTSELDQLESQILDFFTKNRLLVGRGPGQLEKRIEIAYQSVLIFAEKIKALGARDLSLEFVNQFLMEPIGSFFTHFDATVQDCAMALGKKVAPLKFENPEMQIYSEPCSHLFSSLVHAFRNAVDHGIELPDERSAARKPETGQITVSFYRLPGKENQVEIKISDDGRGIPVEKLRKKFNLPDTTPEEEVLQMVFASGATTADSVSLFSGRGVGLGAIHEAATELGGKAWVETRHQGGTCLRVRFPEPKPESRD